LTGGGCGRVKKILESEHNNQLQRRGEAHETRDIIQSLSEYGGNGGKVYEPKGKLAILKGGSGEGPISLKRVGRQLEGG